MRRVLFVQKPEVLEQQRVPVRNTLSDWLREVELDFAGAPEDVAIGADYDAVITPTLPWLDELLTRTGRVGWLHFLSAGVEQIWKMGFDKRAMPMTKSSGVHGPAMSEYAIGAMLYFAKQFGRFHDQAQRAEWQRAWLDELTGRQLTVLGMGHIGQSLAKRAGAFDMKVVGTLRRIRAVDGVARVVPLAEIASELVRTDYLVVCLPLTDETRGLVDETFLLRLKPGAVLVDISRGGVVRGDGVVAALENGHLRGAALDVFEQQPLPPESPLWQRPDVLITPHVSGTTPFYLERALSIFLHNANAFCKGDPFITPVDIELGY